MLLASLFIHLLLLCQLQGSIIPSEMTCQYSMDLRNCPLMIIVTQRIFEREMFCVNQLNWSWQKSFHYIVHKGAQKRLQQTGEQIPQPQNIGCTEYMRIFSDTTTKSKKENVPNNNLIITPIITAKK